VEAGEAFCSMAVGVGAPDHWEEVGDKGFGNCHRLRWGSQADEECARSGAVFPRAFAGSHARERRCGQRAELGNRRSSQWRVSLAALEL